MSKTTTRAEDEKASNKSRMVFDVEVAVTFSDFSAVLSYIYQAAKHI